MSKTLLSRIQDELRLSVITSGLYVEDLDDGETIRLSADKLFPSASVATCAADVVTQPPVLLRSLYQLLLVPPK
jgi:hypothetical protein